MRRTATKTEPTEAPPTPNPVEQFVGVEPDAPPPEGSVDLMGKAEAPTDGQISMGPGYERIQRRLFAIDEAAEYEELEQRLTFGQPAHRAEYSVLLDALELAEDNARRAHRLYVNGKVALEAFEADAEVIEAGMRDQAFKVLQEEKDRGQRSKAPTKDDIQAELVQRFPDEYRALAVKRAQAKRMVEHFERLADLWKSRARSLDTMVTTSRR